MRSGDALPALQIEGVHASGAGAGRAQGFAVVVAGAAPGDEVDARVSHVSPHAPPTAWADAVRVRWRGDDFAPPPCGQWAPTNGRCGGCPVMHLSADAQGRWKRQQVQACLDAAGALGVEVVWCPPPAPLGYRNRAHYVAARDAEGGPMLGAYAPRSHDVIPQGGCLVVHPLIDATATRLVEVMRALAVPIAPTQAGVRYITLRVAPSLPPPSPRPRKDSKAAKALEANPPRCLVEWICTDLDAPWLPALLDATCALPEVAGAGASLNDGGGNALHAAPPAVWRGAPTVTEQVGPLAVALTTDAFFQLNTAAAARMYARASAWVTEWAAEQAADPLTCVWDLYCGAGALGVTVALEHAGATLCGAESNPSAVEAARALAASAGIARARFATLDLGRDPLPADWPAPDVVLVNPPRQGLDAALLSALATTPARGMVYMSCSPATLRRDIEALCAVGSWRVVAAEAHDMLPQTAHVEALVALRRG